MFLNGLIKNQLKVRQNYIQNGISGLFDFNL